MQLNSDERIKERAYVNPILSSRLELSFQMRRSREGETTHFIIPLKMYRPICTLRHSSWSLLHIQIAFD
jgi:hypothetical protein